MTLEQIKKHLSNLETVNFELQNGTRVPEHFHITEIGVISKHFIDCGGKVRNEKVANFQLWNANDFEHKLKPQKLLNIITLAEKVLEMDNLEIEVEFQTETIGKFGIEFNGTIFILINKLTKCFASDSCGVPKEKLRINIADVITNNTCSPGGGCC